VNFLAALGLFVLASPNQQMLVWPVARYQAYRLELLDGVVFFRQAHESAKYALGGLTASAAS
jgi:hypothetical protein